MLLGDKLLRSGTGIGSSQQRFKSHYFPVSRGKYLVKKEKFQLPCIPLHAFLI